MNIETSLQRVDRDGTVYIRHAEYQQSLVTKSLAQLRYIMADAKAAVNANPGGSKSGYYEDEILYAAMEITRREEKAKRSERHHKKEKERTNTR